MKAYHYGVVVGISRYPGITDLSAPVLDAQDFHDWLVDPSGGQVPAQNVRMVTTPDSEVSLADPWDARPIKRDIDRALEQINGKADHEIGDAPGPWSESRLYLYVAGHGIMPHGGETALLLADARSGAYENLELRAYREWYCQCARFREIVIFADCCRNWHRNVRPSSPVFTDCPRPGGQVAWLVGYAAGPGNPAYEMTEEDEEEPPDERRGYFTQALLQGLRSAPIDPEQGAITSTTLAPFVRLAVQQATGHKRLPQKVEMPSDPSRPIVLGIASVGSTVTIRFPERWTQPVELLLHGNRRIPYDPVIGPWTIKLQAGLYAVVLPDTFDGSPFADSGRFMVLGDNRDIQL